MRTVDEIYEALVVETGDGERFIVGAVAEGGGNETLRGDVYITGRLFLNGKEVTVKEEDA